MTSPRLTALRAQFGEVRTAIDTIERSVPEGQELPTERQTELNTLFDRAEQLRPEIETLATREQSLDATAAVLARLGATRPAEIARSEAAETPPMTPGEYFVLLNRSFIGDQAATTELSELRASIIDRVPAEQALADNPGVVPTVIVDDLIKFVDAQRPVISSLRQLPMFKGDGRRPRVTQHTQVGVQTAEFDELPSRKMLIVKDNLTRVTYGGYVDISEQDDEFTEPGMMQILIEDLADQYAIETENAAADALVAAATNTFELPPAIDDPKVIIAALFGGANEVYTNSKRLPNTLWAAPDRWAFLGGLVDSTGRPIWPALGPDTGSGGATVVNWDGKPLNLKFVVSPEFAAGTLIIGDARRGEVREQRKGLARGAFKPSQLSTEVGYRGYMSTYFRPEAFVKLLDEV